MTLWKMLQRRNRFSLNEALDLCRTVQFRPDVESHKVMGFGHEHENPSCEDPTWTNNVEGPNS